MVEERVVEVERPAASTHTVVTDDRSGGGAGWLIAIVLVVALVVGIFFLTNMQNSRSAKDNAIANAADSVGTAAKKVGNAAEDVVDGSTKN